MNITCIVVGIDNWDTLTYPLVASIRAHEPEVNVIVVDNGSKEPYPREDGCGYDVLYLRDTICYSAAINAGIRRTGDADWLVVLSNDVLCAGLFAHILRQVPSDVLCGARLIHNIHYDYIEGWCVCINREVWRAVGWWDEDYPLATAEDLDYSYRARMAGFRVAQILELPFVHLDARQRFANPALQAASIYAGALFERKHNIPAPLRRYSPTTMIDTRWWG